MEANRHRHVEIINTTLDMTFGYNGFAYHIHNLEHQGRANHRIYGSFSVAQTLAGNVLDIKFYVLTLQQFIDWMSIKHTGNEIDPQAAFTSKRQPNGSFNLQVSRSGSVYFLLDNRFSFNTAKRVQLLAYEEWDEPVNTKLDIITTVPPMDRGLSNDVGRIISEAKTSLMMMTPYIDMTFLDKIISKAQSNVDVKIITRPQKEAEGKDKKATLAYIKQHLAKNHRVNSFIHSRAIIRDEEEEVLISSADLTHDSLVTQFNAGVISSEPALIKKLIDYFNMVWQKSGDSKHDN